jgi:Fe-S-cluster containining protein
MSEADVDCEAGRALGCQTFCCRLLVRLDPDEREPSKDGLPPKGFVDKDLGDGLCIHLDRVTHRCRIWAKRPRVCREYHCNGDEMLQAALKLGHFRNIVEVAKAAVQLAIPREAYVRIPLVDERKK